MFVLIGSLLPSEAAQCNLSELGLQFNTREKSVMHLANLAYGAGAEERVKHQIAWFSSGKDHGFNQSGRESSEVCLREGLGINTPDGPPVTGVAGPDMGGFTDRIAVIEIVFILRQQKDIFVGAGGPVLYRLGLAVRFVPDDIGAEKPTVGLQGECQLPGNADEVLRLETGGRGRAVAHASGRVLFVRVPPGAIAAGIGIADVEPQRAVIPENSADFAEDGRDIFDVPVQFHLCADLVGNAVVAKSPVRRAGNAGLKNGVRKSAKDCSRVADENA